MENITSVSELKLAIVELEIKQKKDWLQVKEETANTIEALKPENIIKQSIKNVVSSNSIKENLMANAAGLITGFASKALFIRNSTNPVRKIFGTLLQLAVTKLIAKNPKAVLTVTDSIQSLFPKKIETLKTLSDSKI
jgi:hypothetical protein